MNRGVQRGFFRLAIVAGLLAGSTSAWLVSQEARRAGNARQIAQEEAEDYFHRWLNQDVVYIITPEEREVFQVLTTPEEKERFIEQFWQRRDLDPRTPENEARIEHYRRIAYANENFTAGVEGWRTDRGRIYIIHGPPHEIQSVPAGQIYNRPSEEGGGTTRTFGFEIWRYLNLPGIANEVELEFVDKRMSGLYELVLSPYEKDMLLTVPGMGMTLAEELGFRDRKDHPIFNPAMQDRDNYPFLRRSISSDPFQRMERAFAAQQPPELKHKDLQELVTVDVAYENLRFGFRADYFSLNDSQNAVPVTLEWQNRDLTFVPEADVYRARIAVYGIVTSMSNEIITEFEHDVVTSYTPDQLEFGQAGRSLYQKVLPLRAGHRYKLVMVCKDLNSGNTGVIRKGLAPPKYAGEKLAASPVILSNFIRLVDESKENLMFVLGDVWIRPSLSNRFRAGDQLGAYLQLYNAGIDQATAEPSLGIRYRILQEGRELVQLEESDGRSVHYYSPQRVVLIKVLRLKGLTPGKYQFEVAVEDRIKGEIVSAVESFSVVEMESTAAE